MTRSKSPTISVSRRGSARGEIDCTVVWVRGEHDLATKVLLADAVTRAARLDGAPVLVDLSAVTFMDASTVGAIVASRNRLRPNAQSLELRAPSALALRVLDLCGLTDLVHQETVRPTGADALATWVDVLPIAPGGGKSPRSRIASAAGVEAATARVEADRVGP
jgi:anti-anti-sigma factor